MRVIGVTGGIGSGKTTLCGFFRRWGAQVIDADGLGREVVERDPSVLKRLEVAFGRSILNPDGSLNRRRLGRLAFKSSENRLKLNRIVHPPLLKLLKERIKKAKGPGPVIIDAALLGEWEELSAMLDFLILVRAKKRTRKKRIGSRWSLREIEERMALQLPAEELAKKADLVIDNDGTLKELEAEAWKAWETISQHD